MSTPCVWRRGLSWGGTKGELSRQGRGRKLQKKHVRHRILKHSPPSWSSTGAYNTLLFTSRGVSRLSSSRTTARNVSQKNDAGTSNSPRSLPMLHVPRWTRSLSRLPRCCGPPACVFFLAAAFSDDADVPRDITAHAGRVRGVLEQMNRTFDMARARSDLRAAIEGRRQGCAAAAPVREGGEKAAGLGRAGAAGETGVGGKEVSEIR